MAKVVLNDIANTESSSIVAAVNANNTLIETAIENTLSRDGTAPNTMGANIDMNSYRVINLPIPTVAGEAVRKDYVDALVATLNEEKLDEALAAYTETLTLRDETQDLRDEAEGFRDEAASFVGAAVSAQALSTARTFTFTGEATGTSAAWDGSTDFTVALTIPNSTVTNAKMANMVASRVKGRLSTTGAPQDLTGSQVTGILDVYGTGTAKGLVDRGGTTNTTEFLRRDGNWGTPPSASVPSSGTYTTTGSTPIGDMIRKWGVQTLAGAGEGGHSFSFASPFPNACVSVQVTTGNPGGHVNADAMIQVVSFNASGISTYVQGMASTNSRTFNIYWEAWGY